MTKSERERYLELARTCREQAKAAPPNVADPLNALADDYEAKAALL